ncbi:MAG TPA: prolyl oligopeptidase family serine peptidase [Gemmatimonadaceae bacterium]|nr:prolyl oligopeptidase family serine peptidase [Gemmatimonadaceae bacterium]
MPLTGPRSWRASRAVLFLLALAPASAAAQPAAERAPKVDAERVALEEANARYVQPPAPIADFFSRDPNFATLNAPSPDGRYFMVPRATQLSTLELMSRPTYRLAELEVRPATDRLWHLDTYGVNGLRIYDMEGRRFRDVQLPAGTFVSDMTWSPDGARLAFLAHLPQGTEVWTADAATGRASRFSDARVLATLGTAAQVEITQEVDLRPSRMLQWTPEGTILTLAVPAGRGAEPAESRVPAGPVVRLTRPEPTPSRTFPNLLRDEHDASLFEHFTRAQLVELAEGRAPRPLGEPRMYESISLSADGRHVLARFVERPFSYITSWRGFPGRTVVLARDGSTVATLETRALREGGGRPGGAGGLRALAWRPDGAGLTYLRRAPKGGDQVMLLAAPFDTASARAIASSEDDIRGVVFSRDGGRAFATVAKGGRTAIVHWDLRTDSAQRRILVPFHHPDSLLTHPGELWTERTPNGIGYALLSAAGDAAWIRGEGLAADFRPRPFVDRAPLTDTVRTRVFQGSKERWERPLVALDADLGRMVVSREARDVFPDSWLWTRGGGMTNLTRNRNPFPELEKVRRIDFSFKRRDGLEVQGRVALPVGWREGQKVPAIFWTYPREYTTPAGYTRAAIRDRNHNAFTNLTWLRWSELWLTQGYALVSPDIPIIGENYNDTYIANMVDAMYGAMRAVDRLGVVDLDRIGHGGHSYGAFATANLLAHTPFFRAGIAGDGAYNRSLTPFGFQAEPRNMWSAPDTYLEMSPFFKADQIDSPLLMYHGADDNNTGTWPMQSERFMEALTSLGKNAALYVYPFESHTPRAIENNLDMWARWVGWFDRYVKGAGATAAPTTATDGQR